MLNRTLLGGIALGAAVAAAPAAAEATSLPKVEKRGSGDVEIVLIPGLVSDWSVWEKFMDRNEDEYTMYAVTLAGFGGEQAPPQPADNTGTPWIDGAVKSIAALIEEEGLDDPVVMGHSLGGLVAMRLGAEHADIVGPVVTVDGMPAIPLGPQAISKEQRVQLIEQHAADQLLNMPEDQWAMQRQQYARQLQEATGGEKDLSEMVSKTPASVAGRYMFELMKTDLSDDLAKMDDPVLAVAAIEDAPEQTGMTAEEHQQRWKSAMAAAPKAEFVWAPNANHFIMLDAPDMFDKEIRRFIRQAS